MTWQPHITVATVVYQNDQLLMVWERSTTGQPVMNQPAGHLEPGETLLQAAMRETLEETCWQVELEAILRLNLYTSPQNNITYLRCNFLARPVAALANAQRDPDIEAVVWLSAEQIKADRDNWRSPMVGQAVDDFLSAKRYPLSLLYHHLTA